MDEKFVLVKPIDIEGSHPQMRVKVQKGL